ncbi:MAG: hypothetical protein ACP5VR_03680 [Acidimicrobiales bacterium]
MALPLVALATGATAVVSSPAASAAGVSTCSGTVTSYTISAVAGTPQSAETGEAFGTDLVAQVLENTPTGSCPAAGIAVTFSTPTSGPSASFNGDVNVASVATDQSGDATAPTLYANSLVGAYTVVASASVTSAEATFSLANTTVGVPATVQATSGGGQSATVGTAFAQPLQVTVTDAYGDPVAGADVNFAVVAEDGAGATFVGGGTSAQETTNAEGQATSPVLEAGTTAGSFYVTATVTGATVAEFTLADLASAPYAVTPGAGSGQEAPFGADFAVPLAVTVTDDQGHPVVGASVSFSAPLSGPSGVFAGAGQSVTVRTNSDGVATAPAFSAGMQACGYVVVARVAGLSQVASFALVNTARTSASVAGPAGAYWAVTNRAQVLGSGGAVIYGWPKHPRGQVVAMAAVPDGLGYWLVTSAGAVYAYGQARYLGGPPHPVGQVVAMAGAPDGLGYWLVTSAGAVYAYGDAKAYGSPEASGLKLSSPVVAMAGAPDGRGYWLVSSDGGVFAYGDATFYGSGVDISPRPVRAIVVTPDGGGYWLISANGTVAGFGDAGAQGSGAPPKGTSLVAGAAA